MIEVQNIDVEKIIDDSLYYEWSYEEIRDVGIEYIELEKKLLKKGKTLTNANPYNVYKYVDLRVISSENIVSSKLIDMNFLLDIYAYYLLILEIFSKNVSIGRDRLLTHKKIGLIYNLYTMYGVNDEANIQANIINNSINSIISEKNIKIDNILDDLESRINRIIIDEKSRWGDYQNSLSIDDYRLNKIVSILNELPECKTVLELGGNQGTLSLIIAQRIETIEKVICTDYDEIAVSKLYKKTKKNDFTISPRIYDVTRLCCPGSDLQIPYDHLKSDVVIALALSHHLILTQGLSMDAVFVVLGNLANRYIIIEFMPLGLWDGTKASIVPEWYTFENFKMSMEKHFKILRFEEIATNRIVFVGEKEC